jgi:hypothetical protein
MFWIFVYTYYFTKYYVTTGLGGCGLGGIWSFYLFADHEFDIVEIINEKLVMDIDLFLLGKVEGKLLRNLNKLFKLFIDNIGNS